MYIFYRLFFCWISLIALSGFFSISLAQNHIVLNDNTNQVFIKGKLFYFYEDKSGGKTIQQVIKEDDSLIYFLSNPDASSFHTKNATSNYWFKIALKNNANSRQHYIVESFNYRLDTVVFYETQKKVLLHSDSTGVVYPFLEREIIHKNLIFSFWLDANEDKVIYLKVHNKNFTPIEFVVRKLTFFTSYASTEYFFLGLFYGIILLLLLLNSINAVYLKSMTHLYYSLYLFSVGIFFMSQDGTGFQYIWPKIPVMNDFGYLLSVYFIIVFMLLYSSAFLNLKTAFPKRYKLFMGYIILRSILLIGTILFIPQIRHFLYIDVIPFILVFYVAYTSYQSDNQISKYFLIGVSILVIGILLNFLRFMGIIESNVITFYSINFCFLLEMVIIYFTLAERIRYDTYLLKKENH